MNLDYPTSFNELFSIEYPCSEADKYVGQGNPASKILIIAKECAGEMTDSNKELTIPYIRGIRGNFEDWKEKRYLDIEDWFDAGWDWNKYHPREPFKGQLLLRDNRKPDIKGSNRGTSPTWCAYQKFINELLPHELKVKRGEPLNFYKYCFISELSSYPKPNSRQVTKETLDSINARINNPSGILRQRFFKEFPVIILSCYKYIDWYNIPIMEYFNNPELNLKYEYKGIIVSEEGYRGNLKLYQNQYNNSLAKGEFINVHEGMDSNGQKHLLLHTSHFQMKTDTFLKAVADLVRPLVCFHMNRQ